MALRLTYQFLLARHQGRKFDALDAPPSFGDGGPISHDDGVTTSISPPFGQARHADEEDKQGTRDAGHQIQGITSNMGDTTADGKETAKWWKAW